MSLVFDAYVSSVGVYLEIGSETRETEQKHTLERYRPHNREMPLFTLSPQRLRISLA